MSFYTQEPNWALLILTLLYRLTEKFQVVLPLHPRTKNIVRKNPVLKQLIANVQLIEPVGHLYMLLLEKNAICIATDSGGIRKETFFEVPCFALRDETEWVELVDLGWNSILSPELKVDQLLSIVEKKIGQKGEKANPYGNGNASKIICNRLLK